MGQMACHLEPEFKADKEEALSPLQLRMNVHHNHTRILRASPFRTDDWPLFDPDAKIVTVKKPAKPETKTEVDWERPAMTL
jgi:hypothetical protein